MSEVGGEITQRATRMWMWIRPPRRAMWVFPVLIGILVVTFSALGVSGSSTPLFGSEGCRDGVVAGSLEAAALESCGYVRNGVEEACPLIAQQWQ